MLKKTVIILAMLVLFATPMGCKEKAEMPPPEAAPEMQAPVMEEAPAMEEAEPVYDVESTVSLETMEKEADEMKGNLTPPTPPSE